MKQLLRSYENYITREHIMIYTENEHIYLIKEEYNREKVTKTDFGEIDPLNMTRAINQMKIIII